MNFNQAIAAIAEILEGTGTHINTQNYDGIIVKKLEASNTLDEGRTTNQTHIAITGEQMDIFPYIRSSGYFDNDDAELKKYFITQIPVKLFESNITYLAGEPVTDITFTNGTKLSATSVVRSKRQNQADQIQVSLINFDNPDFITFRRMMNTGSYLVILKEKQRFEYAAFGIKAAQVTEDLQTINNHFYKLATNTPVNVETIAANNAANGQQTNGKAKFGANKIFYGAPGCGKSRHVSDMLDEASVAKDNIIRVTFHPEYANCDFIGQILPTVETKVDEATGEEKEIVKYIFNPGPFTLALQTAYGTNDMVFLIVEEINRGNAAAIFGDMFQLLDRVKDSGKPNYCASEYPVSNPNMQKYLIESISDEAIKAARVLRENLSRRTLQMLWTSRSSAESTKATKTAILPFEIRSKNCVSRANSGSHRRIPSAHSCLNCTKPMSRSRSSTVSFGYRSLTAWWLDTTERCSSGSETGWRLKDKKKYKKSAVCLYNNN